MISELLKSHKTIVCVGSGGVGKTTTAAAIGLCAAEHGMKAVILTVDPAQRLATTLKLTGDVSQEIQVFRSENGGELWASLVQPRVIFDEFIRSCAPTTEAADRLIRNKLYEQLATRLSGSQEFTSLEKLFQLKQKGNFDLIILDTPPTQNAVDFLLAPQKLLNLFDESITRWLVGNEQDNSLWRNIIGFGTAKALNSLEFLTGSRFIQDLMDFFASMREFQLQLRSHAAEVNQVLRGPNTGFFLITGFEAAKLSEAEQVTIDLKKMGFQLSAVMINRACPLWLTEQTNAASELTQLPKEWVELYQKTESYYRDRLKVYREFAKTQNKNCEVFMAPQLSEGSMDGLDGLRKLYRSFQQGTEFEN